MSFASFKYVHLLWLIIGLVVLYAFSRTQASKRISTLGQERVLNHTVFPSLKSSHIQMVAFLSFYIFAVLALMGPRAGFHYQKVPFKGVDVVIVLDVSQSMLAKDVKPSRLDRAKMEVKDLVSSMGSDRIGLVIFAGEAVVMCPLTVDKEAFMEFLDIADTQAISLQGTNIASALEEALGLLERAAEGQGAIVLITDGEDHSGRLFQVVQKVAEKKIPIYAVAVGSREGAPVPLPEGGFLKDSNGQIVISKANETALARIASLTGGAFISATGGSMFLSQIYRDHMLKLARRLSEERSLKLWNEKFQYPLLLALACLVFYGIWEELRG